MAKKYLSEEGTQELIDKVKTELDKINREISFYSLHALTEDSEQLMILDTFCVSDSEELVTLLTDIENNSAVILLTNIDGGTWDSSYGYPGGDAQNVSSATFLNGISRKGAQYEKIPTIVYFITSDYEDTPNFYKIGIEIITNEDDEDNPYTFAVTNVKLGSGGDLNDYVTKTEFNTALDAKQDKLNFYSEEGSGQNEYAKINTEGDINLSAARIVLQSTWNGNGININPETGVKITEVEGGLGLISSGDNINLQTSNGAKATYNNQEIATLADVEDKQDKLQYYTESSNYAQINTTMTNINSQEIILQAPYDGADISIRAGASNQSYLELTTSSVGLTGNDVFLAATSGKAYYNSKEIATVDDIDNIVETVALKENVRVGLQDLSMIGFTSENLVPELDEWTASRIGGTYINIQGTTTYEVYNTRTAASLSYSIAATDLDNSIRESWFTLSFYTRYSTAQSDYNLQITIPYRSTECYINNVKQEVSADDNIVIQLPGTTTAKFHTVSFKREEENVINPSLDINFIFPDSELYLGLVKLEVGMISTITPVQDSNFSMLESLKEKYSSSDLLSILTYWFNWTSYISQIEIMDCTPVNAISNCYSVRLRFIISVSSTSQIGILRNNSLIDTLFADFDNGDKIFFYDIIVPYKDGKFEELDFLYQISI